MNVMRHKVGTVLFILLILLSGISPTMNAMIAPVTYSVRGKVIDRQSRQPVAYANVFVVGIPGKGASTDSLGTFKIEQVPPGIYSLEASCIGYQTVSTPEYIVSASTPFIEIEMEEDANLLNTVVVVPSPFRRSIESPVSMRIIGLQEIEKSPGANRDVSRIVRSYPGVSFSPIGYRNDLIVRGGSPSENRFYMDGIEIPNINHFATQGASGGPVSIVNADLIREITFYTGAFPANRSGALSSVLDFRLKDGNPDKQAFKATIGASEVSLSGAGHLGQRTTYLFSARQSYLQLLFKALGLPFLPNFIDGQFKTKTRFNEHSELTLLGLVGIDKMKLNTDENAEYLLSYLPTIHQETFTLGASYRHYNGRHVQSLILSHNYLNNRNLKYRNNDDSSEDNLTLRLRSTEQKTTLRFENQTRLGAWTLKEGAKLNNSIYTNHSRQRLYGSHSGTLSIYETSLNIFGWGAFFSSNYTTADKRLALSAGIRMDGNTYNRKMRQLWKQFSPRLSASYKLSEQWTLSGSTGLYHQLPPYTALGYKDNEGQYLNKNLKYMQVFESSLGVDWHLQDRFMVSAEGYFKRYSSMPLSLQDNIPLACKGNDYGVTGNKLKQPDVIMSTGIIENPSAPVAEQRYKMKYLKQESGTILPTLGITVEF